MAEKPNPVPKKPTIKPARVEVGYWNAKAKSFRTELEKGIKKGLGKARGDGKED